MDETDQLKSLIRRAVAIRPSTFAAGMRAGVAFRSCAKNDSSAFSDGLKERNATRISPSCLQFPGLELLPGRTITTCACATDYCNGANRPSSTASSALLLPVVLAMALLWQQSLVF